MSELMVASLIRLQGSEPSGERWTLGAGMAWAKAQGLEQEAGFRELDREYRQAGSKGVCAESLDIILTQTYSVRAFYVSKQRNPLLKMKSSVQSEFLCELS